MLPAAISFTVIFCLDSAQVIKYFLNQQCNDFIEIFLRLSLHAYHREMTLIEISLGFISLSHHTFLFGHIFFNRDVSMEFLPTGLTKNMHSHLIML